MELDQELLTQVLVVVAGLLGGALGLALVALVLKYAARWFKDFVAVVRDYTPKIIEHVNQPSDPVNAQLDRWLDRLYPYGWDVLAAKVLPAMLRAAADAIAAAEPGVPLPERETIRLPEVEGGTIVGVELERETEAQK